MSREKGYKNKIKNASKIIKNDDDFEKAIKKLCEKWNVKNKKNGSK